MLNWHALSEIYQTWAKAKEHFNKEYADRMKHSKPEARQAGYGSAANATYQREDIAEATCEIIQHINSHTEARVSTMGK